MNRWSKKGVLDRVFAALQEEEILRVHLEVVALDSTSVKVHPDGTGAPQKKGCKPSANPGAAGTPRFIQVVAADDRRAVTFALPLGRRMMPRKGGLCCAVWGHNQRSQPC